LSGRQSKLFSDTSKTSDTLPVLQGLSRDEVLPLAGEIRQFLVPFSWKVEIAGSFRRLRPTVNDLDFVVQPVRFEPAESDDNWLKILKTLRMELDVVTVKQGPKLAVLNVPFVGKAGPGYVQVDLYRAKSSTWGILLLVRTGSKEHNVKLCNLAISKDLRLQYSVGLTDKGGRVVAGRSEEEVFAALGLPFIPPQERESP